DYRPPRPIEQPRPVINLFVRQALADVRGSAVQVSVEITVDANGRVSSIKPFTATDSVPKRLWTAAADAAKRWKFEPARLNGQAVAGPMILTFRFAGTGAN
ncbi:MAG TPA: TonB family protein, partial [Bryobacteraceae bacterium]|nr:TonB family protein [Bryobacteraceae bacterium]